MLMSTTLAKSTPFHGVEPRAALGMSTKIWVISSVIERMAYIHNVRSLILLSPITLSSPSSIG